MAERRGGPRGVEPGVYSADLSEPALIAVFEGAPGIRLESARC